MVNPFPNVRMVVKDGVQLWCLKDFAIAIGFTQVSGALKLLTDLEKEGISDLETPCIRSNGRPDNQQMKYAPIETLNAIINRTTLKTPAVTEWRSKMQKVGGEAVKSQLGMENDIDKMVNDRVEKALTIQNSNNSMIQLLIEQGKRSDMLLAQMQEDSKRRDEDSKRRDEDNKRFYAELFGRTSKLEAKVETVNPYKLSITEVCEHILGYNAGSMNKFLIAQGYLYRNNDILCPTDKMKALNYCQDSGNKYHTLYYKDEMIDFAKKLIDQHRADNVVYK